MSELGETDLRLLRRALEIADQSRANGNHPFGALLADDRGQILVEAENTVVTESDCTGHAETNLMRKASRKFGASLPANCTLYASAEPCPMCSGAIFWGNVRRVVFALGIEPLYQMIGDHPENPSLYVHCRDILLKAPWPIEVLGPALEDEAAKVHIGHWQK